MNDELARAEIGAYYAFTGMADRMVDGLLITPAQLREAAAAFAELGADELVLYCYGADPGQLDALAELAD